MSNTQDSEGDRISPSEGAKVDDKNGTNTYDLDKHKEDKMVGTNVASALSSIIGNENGNEILCYESICPDTEQEDEDPLMAYKAVADPDVMHLH